MKIKIDKQKNNKTPKSPPKSVGCVIKSFFQSWWGFNCGTFIAFKEHFRVHKGYLGLNSPSWKVLFTYREGCQETPPLSMLPCLLYSTFFNLILLTIGEYLLCLALFWSSYSFDFRLLDLQWLHDICMPFIDSKSFM